MTSWPARERPRPARNACQPSRPHPRSTPCLLRSEDGTMNEVAAAATHHDLSFLNLFLQADPIVKGVMIMLVLASLGCWTIIFDKLVRIMALRKQARAFEIAARTGDKLTPQMPGAAGHIVAAGHAAWRDQDSS